MSRVVQATAAVLVLSSAACDGFRPEKDQSPVIGRGDLPRIEDINAVVERLMLSEDVPGLALSVIEAGEVRYLKAYGYRDVESNEPLNTDTVMYGASLTKFVFAAYAMQLVDQGALDLDRSIADYLPKPLPDYENFSDLEGDNRWRELTMRMLLGHVTGFPNFRFFPPEGGYDPDAKLQFFFEPGERYGYSGEGFYVAQLVVEEAFGLNIGVAIQENVFDRRGMTRTGMTWRDDFAPNISSGYTADGEREDHDERSNVHAAGSMDTTISDFAAWVTAFMQNDDLSVEARAEIVRPHYPITSRHQFPPLDAATDPRNAAVELAAGLGVVTWRGPAGRGFFKGGHNDVTDNMLVCLETAQRCVLLLSNTAKGDRIFPQIVDFILGDTQIPWRWEYSSLDVAR